MSKQDLTKTSGTNLIRYRWYLAGKSMYISGLILHCHKKPKPLWKCETVKLVCFATIQSTRTGLLHFLLWTSPASWFKSRISKLRGFVILFWTGRRGRLKEAWVYMSRVYISSGTSNRPDQLGMLYSTFVQLFTNAR